MAAINHAVTVLEDPEKRRRYDSGESAVPPASPQARAITILCALMQQAITQAPDNADMVETVRQNLQNQLTSIANARRELANDIKKLEKRRKRLRGGKLFDSIFDKIQELLDGAPARHDEQEKVVKLALNMLAAYHDSGEDLPLMFANFRPGHFY